MAIDNFQVGNRKNDIKILLMIILGFIFIIWCFTPPGNKLLQLCFWGHQVQYAVNNVINKETNNDYKFFWKNAIYLTKFNDKKAISEMDRAIASLPSYFGENQLEIMFRERAKIKTVFKDYKGALDDYLRVKNLSNDDILRISYLLQKQKKLSLATSYCNRLFSIELGRADACNCIAYIYSNAGKPVTSVRVMDYLIAREDKEAKHFVLRSKYKKLAGDYTGASLDEKQAKELDSHVNFSYAPMEDVVLVNNLNFSEPF